MPPSTTFISYLEDTITSNTINTRLFTPFLGAGTSSLRPKSITNETPVWIPVAKRFYYLNAIFEYLLNSEHKDKKYKKLITSQNSEALEELISPAKSIIIDTFTTDNSPEANTIESEEVQRILMLSQRFCIKLGLARGAIQGEQSPTFSTTIDFESEHTDDDIQVILWIFSLIIFVISVCEIYEIELLSSYPIERYPREGNFDITGQKTEILERTIPMTLSRTQLLSTYYAEQTNISNVNEFKFYNSSDWQCIDKIYNILLHLSCRFGFCRSETNLKDLPYSPQICIHKKDEATLRPSCIYRKEGLISSPIRESDIAWLKEMVWFSFIHDIPAYPTSKELSFYLSLWLDPKKVDYLQSNDLCRIAEVITRKKSHHSKDTLFITLKGRFNWINNLFSIKYSDNVWANPFYPALAKKIINTSSQLLTPIEDPGKPTALNLNTGSKRNISVTTNYDCTLENALELAIRNDLARVSAETLKLARNNLDLLERQYETVTCFYVMSPIKIFQTGTNIENFRFDWIIERKIYRDNYLITDKWCLNSEINEEGSTLDDLHHLLNTNPPENHLKPSIFEETTSPIIVKLHGSLFINEDVKRQFTLATRNEFSFEEFIVLNESSYLETIIVETYFPTLVKKDLLQDKRLICLLGYSLTDWNIRHFLGSNIFQDIKKRNAEAEKAKVQKGKVEKDDTRNLSESKIFIIDRDSSAYRHSIMKFLKIEHEQFELDDFADLLIQ